MNTTDYKKIILENYKERLLTINQHIDVWQKKVDELNSERNQINMIIEITEKELEKEDFDNKLNSGKLD